MAEYTPPADPLEPDDFNDNDSSLGDDAAEIAPSTASLTSSILSYRKENGRTYHGYRDGSSIPLPQRRHRKRASRHVLFALCDLDLLLMSTPDFQHHIFYLSLDGKLGLAPPNNPGATVGRVLDLGTGTGIWAMDFGDEHPEAEITGIDLSPIQPSFVPPNVRFIVDDYEDDWIYSEPFQYIHSRMNNSSISDWQTYIRRAYENLSPGGYIEIQDFTLPTSDDGSLTPSHALQRSMTLLGQAAAGMGRPFIDLATIAPMLRAAGFRDVTEHRFRWPSNAWPRDPLHKSIGAWNHENILSGLQGFLMAALTRGLGWSAEEVDVLAAQARKDMKDRGVHAYWPMIVVTGRKPET